MKSNNWKKGFFLLLGIDIIVTILILTLILTPSGQNIGENSMKLHTNKTVSFYVKSNKNDVNQLINGYLMKRSSKSPIRYQVKLGNEVEFYGRVPFLGDSVDMRLSFEPKALPNGDLKLTQKSATIGHLQLPVASVLKLVMETYDLPSGVDIRPNERVIYIQMSQLKLKSHIIVKVNEFDLKKDQIAFTLFVPTK